MTSGDICFRLLDEAYEHFMRAGHDRFSDEMYLSKADYNMGMERIALLHQLFDNNRKNKE